MSASSVLTTAAWHYLRPLGMRQEGRFRMWFDDNEWWLGVVEFQSSLWSTGSYINVGVMWLWNGSDRVVYDLVRRLTGRTDYRTDEQFRPEAERLVHAAAERISDYRRRFPGPAAVVAHYGALSDPSFADEWNMALAQALLGDAEPARQSLLRLARRRDDDPAWLARRRSEAMVLATCPDADSMRAAVQSRVGQGRSALRLAG